MKKLYRVECNHGSKYFKNGFEAFVYFEAMKRRHRVELWLVIVEETKRLYSVKQELIAFSN